MSRPNAIQRLRSLRESFTLAVDEHEEASTEVARGRAEEDSRHEAGLTHADEQFQSDVKTATLEQARKDRSAGGAATSARADLQGLRRTISQHIRNVKAETVPGGLDVDRLIDQPSSPPSSSPPNAKVEAAKAVRDAASKCRDLAQMIRNLQAWQDLKNIQHKKIQDAKKRLHKKPQDAKKRLWKRINVAVLCLITTAIVTVLILIVLG